GKVWSRWTKPHRAVWHGVALVICSRSEFYGFCGPLPPCHGLDGGAIGAFPPNGCPPMPDEGLACLGSLAVLIMCSCFCLSSRASNPQPGHFQYAISLTSPSWIV